MAREPPQNLLRGPPFLAPALVLGWELDDAAGPEYAEAFVDDSVQVVEGQEVEDAVLWVWVFDFVRVEPKR